MAPQSRGWTLKRSRSMNGKQVVLRHNLCRSFTGSVCVKALFRELYIVGICPCGSLVETVVSYATLQKLTAQEGEDVVLIARTARK